VSIKVALAQSAMAQSAMAQSAMAQSAMAQSAMARSGNWVSVTSPEPARRPDPATFARAPAKRRS